jgi:type I restriction enzyme R subunit
MFLHQIGYETIELKSMDDLKDNHIRQISRLNNTPLTPEERKRYFSKLKGDVFDRAKLLRDQVVIDSDEENSKHKYLRLLDIKQPDNNVFQVVSQPEVQGAKGKNIYDVVILLNGLPIVHIELKRKGIHYKEAENQLLRYARDSFGADVGMFLFTQLFVVSNETETRYFANNTKLNNLFHFTWAKEDNSKVTNLFGFAGTFFEKEQLFKFITDCIVLKEKTRQLFVLRPYQYYAVENIVAKVRENSGNGYIWHTTGSGKTLTSFKASQTITKNPAVRKVIFVVDRKDLDKQTAREFNAFAPDSVNLTKNTDKLVERLENDTKLIVTTIQKLNNAINKAQFRNRISHLRNERLVFIIDEAHRGQFGKTHKSINKFFTNAQLFGFTGTPIFEKNAFSGDGQKLTTKDLFGECLHKYVITDAISDGNVLRFSVEYVGQYSEKTPESELEAVQVAEIDTSELYETRDRLEKIYKYIIANHHKKVGDRHTAIFCVSSIDTLCRYYEIFKEGRAKGEHELKVATVFSYGDNDDHVKLDGYESIDDPEQYYGRQHSERLADYVKDFNELFETSESISDYKAYDSYFSALSDRVKAAEVDILLVVGMFLTGFDAPTVNTLYVDKNLKYHGLIQAFSRTNRILDEKKPQGNIVCFRNLKEATDEAVALFSDKNASEVIFTPPYEQLLEKYLQASAQLLELAPRPSVVDGFQSEELKKSFVEAFKALLIARNKVKHFDEFGPAVEVIDENTLAGYANKYQAIRDQVSMLPKGKESILQDVEFNTVLLHKDDINVDYIFRLLGRISVASKTTKQQLTEELLLKLGADEKYRSKLELIRKFIATQLDGLENPDETEVAFKDFVAVEREAELKAISTRYSINPWDLQSQIQTHQEANQSLSSNDLLKLMTQKPRISERLSVGEELLGRVVKFMQVFDWSA